MSHKKVYRFYQKEALMVQQRRRRKVASVARVMPHANRSGRLAVLLTLLLLFLVHSETVSAETSVSGTISSDTTWALAIVPSP